MFWLLLFYLVTTGDITQIFYLQLLQQVLLRDAGQELWLASEVVAVLVIVICKYNDQPWPNY